MDASRGIRYQVLGIGLDLERFALVFSVDLPPRRAAPRVFFGGEI